MKKLLTLLLSVMMFFCLANINENTVKAETDNYLTFTADHDSGTSSVSFKWAGGTNVKYSTKTSGGSWSDFAVYTAETPISLANKGDAVRFKGTNVITSSSCHFVMSGKIAASGDVTSLLNGETANPGGDVTLTSSQFRDLFNGQIALVDISELRLPSTTLNTMCYYQMFYQCTGITTVPTDFLPATSLQQDCYYGMFNGCTNLKNVPKLPATTLGYACYRAMFNGCSSIKSVPKDLLSNATALTEYCYYSMFQDCTNLANVPDLPAVTLKTSCYENMFYGCSKIYLGTQDKSLGSIVLLATATATNAVNTMFWSTGSNLTPTITNPATIYYYQKYPVPYLTILIFLLFYLMVALKNQL